MFIVVDCGCICVIEFICDYLYILMVYLVQGVRCILHVYVNGNHTIELTVFYIIWAVTAIH